MSDCARLYSEENLTRIDAEELRAVAEAMGGDEFDALLAQDFAIHRPQPAAQMLDHAVGGLFLVRDCDLATLQPHAVEWTEED